jgi:hypothetical protein
MIVSDRSGPKRELWSASLMSQRDQVRLIQPDLIAL